MKISAGALSDRVTLQHVTTVPGDSGDPVETWTTFSERWARVKAVSSTEKEVAKGLDAQITHSVLLRIDREIKHSDRIVWDGRTLQACQVLHDRLDGSTVILCKETEA